MIVSHPSGSSGGVAFFYRLRLPVFPLRIHLPPGNQLNVLSIIVILMVAFGNGWKGFNISLVVPGIALAGVAVIQLLNGRKVG
jgi:hypothetical protein